MGRLRTAASRFIRRTQIKIQTELMPKTTDLEVLTGRIASIEVRRMESISSLQDVEFKVFSQWGQDGILDWIIERAGIPAHLQTLVEFGVENYRYANTRFLLYNRNWSGLILDGSPDAEAFLRTSGMAWQFDIRARTAWVSRENINTLLGDAGLSGDIGLLSIDIDGNDYWVWEAIEAVNPIIVVCEYNAVFGDRWPISIAYD